VFTYLNPEIRERLIQKGKLVRIDAKGDLLNARLAPLSGSVALNLLGPIPLDPGGGYLIYMAGHEGRGIGLWAKASWGHRLSPEDIN
jgi:hypothetical protein